MGFGAVNKIPMSGFSGPIPLVIAALFLKIKEDGSVFDPNMHARQCPMSRTELDQAFRTIAADPPAAMPPVSATFFLYSYVDGKVEKVSPNQAKDLFLTFSTKDDYHKVLSEDNEDPAYVVMKTFHIITQMKWETVVECIRQWHSINEEPFDETEVQGSYFWLCRMFNKITPIKATPLEGKLMVSFACYAETENLAYIKTERDIGTIELRKTMKNFFHRFEDISQGSVVQVLTLPIKDEDLPGFNGHEKAALMDLSYELQDKLSNARPLNLADKAIHLSFSLFLDQFSLLDENGVEKNQPWQDKACNEYMYDLLTRVQERIVPKGVGKPPALQKTFKGNRTKLHIACMYVMKHFVLGIPSFNSRKSIVEDYVPGPIGSQLKKMLDQKSKQWDSHRQAFETSTNLQNELQHHCYTVVSYYTMMMSLATACHDYPNHVVGYLRPRLTKISDGIGSGGVDKNPELRRMVCVAAFFAFHFYVLIQQLYSSMHAAERDEMLHVRKLHRQLLKDNIPKTEEQIEHYKHYRYTDRDQWRLVMKEANLLCDLTTFYHKWDVNGNLRSKNKDLPAIETHKYASVGNMYPVGPNNQPLSVATVLNTLANKVLSHNIQHDVRARTNFLDKLFRAEYKYYKETSAFSITFAVADHDIDWQQEGFSVPHLLGWACQEPNGILAEELAPYLAKDLPQDDNDEEKEQESDDGDDDGSADEKNKPKSDVEEEKQKPGKRRSDRKKRPPPKDFGGGAPFKKKRKRKGKKGGDRSTSSVLSVTLYEKNAIFTDKLYRLVSKYMNDVAAQQLAPLLVDVFESSRRRDILEGLKRLKDLPTDKVLENDKAQDEQATEVEDGQESEGGTVTTDKESTEDKAEIDLDDDDAA